MNHIYRLKRTGRAQQLQAVPETARSAGKGRASTGKTLGQVVVHMVASFALSGIAALVHAQQAPPAVNALPQGGVVTRGSATLANTTTPTGIALMSVNQSSARAVIDWASFNVGSNAKVQFNQPSSSSVVLNQIVGNNASQIYGQVSSNGQVFLSNPNGVYFSPTAQVNVGGLVATTGRAHADDFMAGKVTFNRDGATGSVVNDGQLNAALGGYIALLAPEVRNQGVVVAQAGTVALASGEAITLNFNGGGTGLTGITTTAQTIAALVENRSAVLAEGGQIILSAHALASLQGAVVKNSGQLSATSLSTKGGKIVLMGDNIALSSTSKIEASGATGGGTVLVGGDWQGSGDTRQATQVAMAQGATIEANATQQGDGGKVVLWSDIHNPQSQTTVNGSIQAEAGPLGGNGGKVETSGHRLNVDGIAVSTRAPVGASGNWLLDPYSITISSVGSSVSGDFTSSATSTILGSSINTALASGNVTIQTGGTVGDGLGNGDITVNVPLSWTSGNALSLIALGGVTGFGDITTGSAASTLTINSTTSSSYTGVIKGSGSLIKDGPGSFVLNGGGSTYGGYTRIIAGQLSVANAMSAPLPPATDVTIESAGTLKFGGASMPVASLSGAGTLEVPSAGLLSLILTGNNSTSFSGTLKGGTGGGPGITKQGSGTFTFTGTTSGVFYGFTVSAGTLQIGDGGTQGTLGAYDTQIATGATVVFNRSDTFTASGGISSKTAGAGTVIQMGSGTVVLSGSGSNFSGAVNLNAGTLNLGSSSAIGTASITFGGGALQYSASNQVDYSNKFITTNSPAYKIDTNGQTVVFATALTTGSLNKLGSGTLALTGASTFPGGVTISAGTLQLGNSTSTGTLGTLDVTNNGNLAFKRTDAVTFANTITGTGSVTQLGSGTLTLTGNNSYQGGTNFNAGTLNLGSANAIGTTGTVGTLSFGGGFLQYSASNSTDYSALFSTAASQAYKIDTNSQSLTLASNLSSAGGSLTKSGLGTLTLLGSNTYGTTTINAGGGILQVGNGGTAGTLGSGAVTVTTTGVNTGTLAINRSDSFTVANAIGGTGSLSLLGSGTLTFATANTYSGGTTISAGGAVLTHAAGLGTFTVTLASGATVDLQNVTSVPGMVLNGGLLKTSTGTSSFGFLTMSAPSTIQVDAAAQLTSTGVMTGAAANTLTKTGAGTLVMAGASSTFSGAVNLNAGTLSVTNYGALGTATTGNITVNSGTVFTTTSGTAKPIILNGGLLSGNTTAAFTNMGGLTLAADSTIFVDSGVNWTFQGVITGAGNLTKTGAGTLTYWASANTASGTTTINAGTFGITTTASTGTGPVVNNSNLYFGGTTTFSNTLSGSGTVHFLSGLTVLGNNDTFSGSFIADGNVNLTVGNGGTTGSIGTANVTLGSLGSALVINRSDALTLSGNLGSNLANLVISGAGTITLTGTNTFNRGTALNGGTLVLGSAGANPVDTTATPASNNNNRITFNGGTLRYSAANTTDYSTWFSVPIGGTLKLDTNGQTVTAAQAFSGTIGLTKLGAGTLIWNGASNSQTGVQTISAGTLQLGSAQPWGATATVVVAAGAALDLNGKTVANAAPMTLNGTGINNAGVLINSSATTATYPGLITLGSDIKIAGDTGSILLTATGTISGAYGLTLGGAAGGAVRGIVGTAITGVTKVDAGTWTLSNANTYTGLTTVSGGTLIASGTSSLGSAASGTVVNTGGILEVGSSAEPVTLNGGTLQWSTGGTSTLTAGVTLSQDSFVNVATSNNLVLSGNVTGSFALTKLGAGTLKLSGANSYGATTISDGTVYVGTGGTTGTLGLGAVTDNGILLFSLTTPLTVSNNIGGTGQLKQAGSGLLTLTGNNTYSGQTTLVGPVNLGSATALGATSSIASMAGAVLQYSSANQTDYSSLFHWASSQYTIDTNGQNVSFATGLIANPTPLTKQGAGTLTLTGTNLYTGATTISAGTLQVGNGGATGSLAATAISNNGTLALNRTGTNTISQTMTGSGLLDIQAGTWNVNAANLLSSTSVVNIATGATLGLATYANAVGGLTGAGSVTSGAASTLKITTATGTRSVFSGSISGPVELTKDGTGTEVFQSSNSYGSGARTYLTNGTLEIGDSGALGSSTVWFNSSNGYAPVLALNGVTISNTVNTGVGAVGAGANTVTSISTTTPSTLTGAVTSNSNGGIVLKTDSGAGLYLTNTLAGGALNLVLSPAAGGEIRLGGTVTTSSSVIMKGLGRLTLSGNNATSSFPLSYAAGNTGTIRLANNAALGTGNATVSVPAGATLELGALDGSNLNITGLAMTLASSATSSGGGQLHNVAGHNIWSGAITLNNNSAITVDTGTSLNLTSVSSTVAANSRTIFNLTDGDLTFAALAGSVGTSSYLKLGNGHLYGAINLNEVAKLYARVYDATGAYSSVYGTAASPGIGFYNEAGTRITLISGTDYSGPAVYTGAPTSSSPVGSSYSVSYASGVTVSNVLYYLMGAGAARTWTVSAKPLTLALTGTVSKNYDGNNAATLSSANYALSGWVTGAEGASITQTVGTYDDKNVNGGAPKLVSVNLTAADYAANGVTTLSNYILPTSGSGMVGSVARVSMVISGITASDKIYDATTSATVSTASVVQTGRIGNDVVTVSTVGSFADKNVGPTKQVNLTSTYGGADAGNYTITNQATATAAIGKANLLVVGVGAADKMYDSTLAATLTGTATVAPLGTDQVSVLASGVSGAFTDKNVGTGKPVTVSGYTFTGTDAGNYNVLQPAGVVAAITPAPLSVSGITASNKAYDGTTSATVSTADVVPGGLTGLFSGDTVTVRATGAFVDKNAGTSKTVNLTSSYGGADVGNYAITGQPTTTATITPIDLTISGITASGKTYDGTTSAAVSTAGVVRTGLIGNDVVNTSATGVFTNANAGSRTVALSSVYTGADIGNYTIHSQTTATAIIAPAPLTMTAQDASQLIGQADPAFSARYSGFVNGESASVLSGVSVVRTGADVAAGLYSGVLVPSATAANYTITPVSGSFRIVPADTLLVSMADGSKVYGASLPSLTATSARYLASGNVLRTVTLTPGANGSYTYTDGLGTTGSFTVVTSATSTSDIGNYGITLANFVKTGTNFTGQATQDGNLAISPLAATLGAVSVSKVYSGNTAAQAVITVANKVGADDVSIAGTGSYTDNKNVGNAHSYSLNTQLTGTAAANYYLSSNTATGTDGVITPAALTISGITANNKIYDGTTSATVSTAGVVRSGLIGSDVVTVSASGVFANKNAGQTKTVNLSSSYAGADAGNYAITDQSTTTATISQAALSISGITAANKTYDGTRDATVSTVSIVKTGLMLNDDVTVSATGLFADKNASAGKTVTLSSTYGGVDAGNYQITGQATALADISKAALTISGITASGKTYDGTTSATVSTAAVTKSGLVPNDVVTVSATGLFADANAGPSKTVNLNSFYGGADVGNYTISSQTSTTATIAKATLTMTANDASQLIGLADPSFTARYSGFVNGETSSVLTGIAVTRTGADVAARFYPGVLVPTATSNNYTIAPVNGNFTIVPADTLLVTMANGTKVYGSGVPDLTVTDARYVTVLNSVSQEHIVTLTALGAGQYAYDDTLGTTGSFILATQATSNSGVGNYSITVSPSSFARTGSNFINWSTQAGNLAVTPLAASLGTTSVSKVYNGNTSAQATIAVTNSVGADVVSVLGTGSYTDNKNVGTTHTYSLSTLLTGAAAANYYLASNTVTGADGVITPAALTISGITAANKTYNGNTNATVNTAGVSKAGLMGGDVVTVSATGTFASKNVGTRAVSLSSIYGGADVGNYTIADQASTTATITPATLTISGITASPKTYDAGTTATVSAAGLIQSGLIDGDVVGVSVTGSFATATAGTSKVVNLISSYSGVGNYTVIDQSTTTADIGKATLTVTANNASKVYDGLAYSGGNGVAYGPFVANETASVLGGSLAYSGTSQGAINAGGYVITPYGLSSENYAFSYADGALALGRATLTASAGALTGTVSKVYDRTRDASLSSNNYVTSTWAWAGTDGATITKTAGTFDTKTVGSSKSVTVTLTAADYQATGSTRLDNYVLPSSFAGSVGSITQAPLSIGGITAANKVYDRTTAATVNTSAATKTGLIAGDVVTVSATGAFIDKGAADGKTVLLTSTYAGADAGNYSITDQASALANITQAPLRIGGITAANKMYDRTTAATVNTSAATKTGLIAGDVVTVSASGVFTDKGAADGKTVLLTSTYAGADAGNYSITDQGSTTANITQAPLTISGITAANKTYDGTTAAIVSTSAATKTGLIAGDVVSVSATGAFTDKNAGPGKTVVLTSTYAGADAGNYSITDQASALATITPAALSMTALNAAKLIGQAEPSFSAKYSGFVNGETASVLSNVSVSRVGTDTAANTYNGVLVPTASSGNYTITPVNGNFTIVPADTLLVSLDNSSKTYGSSVPSLVASTAQYVSSNGNVLHNVSLTSVGAGQYTYTDNLGTTGSFSVVTNASSTSGIGNYGITLTNFARSGTNFTNQTSQDANLVVNPLAVSLGAVSVSKVYNGNTAAQASITVANKVGADDVSVQALGSYTDNKNVGNAHTYSLSAQLLGAGALNYYLSATTVDGTNGVITPAPLRIGGITVANKTYDGTTAATVSTAGATRTGLMAGDTVTIAATGVFTDKNAATGKTVNLSSSYSGADAGNYSITDQTSALANITPATLVVMANNVRKTYDGQAFSGGNGVSYSGFLGNDSASVLGGTLGYGGTSQGATNAGNYTLSSAGLSGINYDIRYVEGALTVNPAPLAVTLLSGMTLANPNGVSKPYDGTTKAILTSDNYQLSGWFNGDGARITKTIGVYDTANPGVGKSVSVALEVQDFVASGSSNLANYSLPSLATGAIGTITPAISLTNGVPVMAVSQTTGVAAAKSATGDVARAESYQWPLGKSVKTEPPSDTGLLPITFLNSTEAPPTSAAVAFEQDGQTVSFRTAATPLTRPLNDKVVFTNQLTEFSVADDEGKMVTFMGGMVNRRIMIVAPSNESKRLAKAEMNLVLAAAVMALGKTSPIMLAKLDGVVFDLR